MTKSNLKAPLFLVALASTALSAQAVDIVNDHWSDGTNTDPASPTYSENGIDVDLDGNIESAWFSSGVGTLTPTVGSLAMGNGTNSSGFTTYFTTPAAPITLSIGDQIVLDWTFSPTGSGAENTSRNLRAFFGSSVTRLAGNGTPTGTGIAGYGLFTNMGVTFGVTTPLQILERTTNSTNFLSAGGDYTTLTSGGGATVGNVAFVDGMTYDYNLTVTRTDATSLLIVQTITGGTINGTGSITNSAVDTTASTFAFDTFGLRPSTGPTTATTFNTTGFQVQYMPVPEPAAFATLGLACGLLACSRRRQMGS